VRPVRIEEFDGEVIEKGSFGRPELRVGNGQSDDVAGPALGIGRRDALAEDGDLDAFSSRGLDLNADFFRVDVGDDAKGADVFRVDRFDPDCGPDARDRRVPDAPGLPDLLAAGLCSRVNGIPDGEDDGLFSAFPERVRDVEVKGIVSAAVGADFDAVYGDACFPVHGLEIEENSPGVPAFREAEGPAVPEPVVGPDGLFNAGEGGLDGEGDEDVPVVGFGFRIAGRTDGVFPEAVEVHPIVADHLGAGIIGMRQGGINVGRPARHDASLGGTPGRRRFGGLAGGACGKNKKQHENSGELMGC
jgi:hypothetical protein